MDWVADFKGVTPNPPGTSALEKLPNEILNQVLLYLTMSDTTQKSPFLKDNLPGTVLAPSSLSRTNIIIESPNTPPEKTTLFSCLLTSRRLFDVALPLTYQCPKISSFDKFVRVLTDNPDYGRHVRSLDLSSLQGYKNFEKLPVYLSLCPLVKQLSLPLELFSFAELAMKVFFEYPHIKSLEITYIDRPRPPAFGSSNPHLAAAFSGLQPGITSSINCLTISLKDTLQVNFLRPLLLRIPGLRKLDLNDCRINDEFSFHANARLSHLILNNSGLSGGKLAQTLTTHNSFKNSLEVLNLSDLWDYSDGGHFARGRLRATDVTEIIENIPATLRSLDMRFCKMDSTHIPLLRRLSTHLQELAIGQHLAMQDVEEIIFGSAYTFSKLATQTSRSKDASTNPQLATMANTVAVCQLQQRIHTISRRSGISSDVSRIEHLDLRNMVDLPLGDLQSSILLSPHSNPLKTIELPNSLTVDHEELARFCGSVGWGLKMVGRRIWIERQGAGCWVLVWEGL